MKFASFFGGGFSGGSVILVDCSFFVFFASTDSLLAAGGSCDGFDVTGGGDGSTAVPVFGVGTTVCF